MKTSEKKQQIYLGLGNSTGIHMVKIVFENVSDSLKLVSLVLVVINMYVLMFSNIPFLYRLGITIYIFILLVLFSVALGSMNQLEKSRPN